MEQLRNVIIYRIYNIRHISILVANFQSLIIIINAHVAKLTNLLTVFIFQ